MNNFSSDFLEWLFSVLKSCQRNRNNTCLKGLGRPQVGSCVFASVSYVSRVGKEEGVGTENTEVNCVQKCEMQCDTELSTPPFRSFSLPFSLSLSLSSDYLI